MRYFVDNTQLGKGRILTVPVDMRRGEAISGESILKCLNVDVDSRSFIAASYCPYVSFNNKNTKGATPVWELLESREYAYDGSSCVDVVLVSPHRVNEFETSHVLTSLSSTSSKDVSGKLPNASYFGCGIVGPSTPLQWSIFDVSSKFGASFLFSIRPRIASSKTRDKEHRQGYSKVPTFTYQSIDDFADCGAYNCPWVVCCEGGIPLKNFSHPARAIYLFPSCDGDMSSLIARSTFHVSPPLSEAFAASGKPFPTRGLANAEAVMYDRYAKRKRLEIRSAQEKKRPYVQEGAEPAVSKSSKRNSHSKKKLRIKASDGATPIAGSASNEKKLRSHQPTVAQMLDFSKHPAEMVYLNDGRPKLLLRFSKVFLDRVRDYFAAEHSIVLKFSLPKEGYIFETTGDVNIIQELERFCRCSCAPMVRVIQSYHVVSLAATNILQVCQWIEANSSGKSLRLQTNPPALASSIIEHLNEDVVLNPREFTHVVHVANTFSNGVIMYGMTTKDNNFSTGSGSNVGFQVYKLAHVSKEYFKLWEVENRSLAKISNRRCLCLAGDQGGWVEYLLDHAASVVVVSHKEPHPDFKGHPTFQHLHVRVDEGVAGAQEMINGGKWQFDALLCDTNGDAWNSVRRCARYSHMLKTGGTLVAALKLLVKSTPVYFKASFAKCVNLLRAVGFSENIQIVWLFANGKRERVLIATKVAHVDDETIQKCIYDFNAASGSDE